MSGTEAEVDPTTIVAEEAVADEVTPDCSAEYESENAKKSETKFDNDKGSIFLIGGDDCATKARGAVEKRKKRVKANKDKWYKRKAAEAKKGGKPTDETRDKPKRGDHKQGWSKKAIKELQDFEEDNAEVVDYSDGYTMVSGWKWRGDKVAAGESAGLCIVDSEQANNASCWLLVRNALGDGWENEYSFTIDPALFTETFKLEDYIDKPDVDVSTDLYEGFNGSWKFGKEKNDKTKAGKRRDGITASRFLPTGEKSSKTDFRFEKGSVNIYTYLTGRKDDVAPAALRLLQGETTAAVDEDTVVADKVIGDLEMFNVELEGAISNFAFAAATTALSMLALA